MGKFTISMVIFHSYVTLPEGNPMSHFGSAPARKSGLVKPSEQGLIQGAIASIGKATTRRRGCGFLSFYGQCMESYGACGAVQ